VQRADGLQRGLRFAVREAGCDDAAGGVWDGVPVVSDHFHRLELEKPQRLELERTWLDIYSAWFQRELAGVWLTNSYREKAAERGVYAVAKQMRKQGIPCDIAVSILATR